MRLDEIRALDDRRFEIRLKRRFGALIDALAKSSSYPAFILPERFANTPPTTPITGIVGSGPYRFVEAERRSGALVIYRRFEGYSPTPAGTPSATAGPKLAGFERVEWHIITDPSTAAAALQAGGGCGGGPHPRHGSHAGRHPLARGRGARGAHCCTAASL